MTSIVLVAKLCLGTVGNREKAVAILKKAAQYALDQEPGLLKYCIAAPQDVSDQTTIWMIEEYADQAAFDSHMATAGVIELVEFLQSDPAITTPTLQKLSPVSAFTRIDPVPYDPFIMLANLTYQPGTREQALEGWKKVAAATEKDEPGTLSYNALKDENDENTVRMVEVYENESYLWDVHAKGKELLANKETDVPIRGSLEHAKLRAVGGFLKR